MTDHPNGLRAFRDPLTTTHPDHPVTDDVSAFILDDAVTRLTLLRSPLSLGDALAELHATTSLLAELQTSLRATIAAARDQDHTWQDIARQLQITPATARRRYREARTSNTSDSHVNLAEPRSQTPAHPRRGIEPGPSRPPRLC